ncbi:MAG TPA: alpha/beta hydrolase, partial [Acidimicrobiales bacterium]|nr:alpha/beta hydrolase [Acidimicrobiales bacterium]
GPVVVLVHGVGIGAWAFDEVAAGLVSDHRVLVPHRRGYGPFDEKVEVPRSASVTEQVDDMLGLLGARGIWDATLVGVSGGATLVSALAMAAPGIVRAAVIHEPVLGPLAPELHALLQAAVARLASAAGAGADGVRGFMSGLVGEERMATLPPPALREILRRAQVLRAEVPEFAAFAPSAVDLSGLSKMPVVTSVGSRSPQCRHLAAGVLTQLASATMEVLDGVRHLPQLEAPKAFEVVIRAVAGGR